MGSDTFAHARGWALRTANRYPEQILIWYLTSFRLPVRVAVSLRMGRRDGRIAMGLDMYLGVETYIRRPMEWMSEDEKAVCAPAYSTALELLPGEPCDEAFGITVSYIVAYWRKANAIHNWFVANCQDGRDECQRAFVTRGNLNELLSVCHEVLKSARLIDGTTARGQHMGPDTNGEWVNDYEDGMVIEEPEVIEELLPTRGGFFFGSTGYDEFYLEDVKNTARQLESILTRYEDEEVTFYYQASW